ncbi:MAG: hypothetical protein ACYC2K_00245 [Gemmatimonadales bacterium]
MLVEVDVSTPIVVDHHNFRVTVVFRTPTPALLDHHVPVHYHVARSRMIADPDHA